MSFIRSCFNPRTHEECDNKINITIKILRCFNPRTHEECDFLKHSVCMGILDVSIHALTRSATPTILIEIPFGFSFNPRTHEECDYNRYLLIQHRISFNPRTHEECDNINPTSGFLFLFQSTHSRGVRPHIFFLFYFQIFRTRFSRIFLKNIKSKR